MDRVIELKARVYDLLSLIEQAQKEIGQCNQEIGAILNAPKVPLSETTEKVADELGE